MQASKKPKSASRKKHKLENRNHNIFYITHSETRSIFLKSKCISTKSNKQWTQVIAMPGSEFSIDAFNGCCVFFFVSRLFSIYLIFVLGEIITVFLMCVTLQGWTAFFASPLSSFSFFPDACCNVVNVPFSLQFFSLIRYFCIFLLVLIEDMCTDTSVNILFIRNSCEILVNNSDSSKDYVNW